MASHMLERRHDNMTVRQLRKAIEGVDGNLPVLLAGGSDHSYNKTSGASACNVTYYKCHREIYSEYWGDENLVEGQTCVKGFVIG
jgi:hypothetical protein